MKKILCVVLSAAMIFGVTSCGMSNTGKGAIFGTGGGAAIGAGIGAIFGKGKGAAIGAAVGAAVGATAGTLIGKKMDKQAKELAAINGAQVDTVTDANNPAERALMLITSLLLRLLLIMVSFSQLARVLLVLMLKSHSLSLLHHCKTTLKLMCRSVVTLTTLVLAQLTRNCLRSVLIQYSTTSLILVLLRAV